jgi:hypothetical protein
LLSRKRLGAETPTFRDEVEVDRVVPEIEVVVEPLVVLAAVEVS